MNTLEELKEYFDEHLHDGLDEWFVKFEQETQYTDIHLFLAYLSQRHLVSQETLHRIQASHPVHISSADSMTADFVEAASSISGTTSTLDLPESIHLKPQTKRKEDEKVWGVLGEEETPTHCAIVDVAPTYSQPAVVPDEDDDMGDETFIAPDHVLPDSASAAPSAATPAMQSSTPVSKLPHIEDESHTLEKEIGSGAMGIVFLAREEHLGRKVAFKQLRPDAAVEHELMMRFLREAQITAQLDHPAIVPVYALVKGFQGLPAYTMKVVEGETLDSIIQEARRRHSEGKELDPKLHLSTRIDYFITVCNAMAYAHSKGVLHRDLKPKNILIGQYGEVYVVDWGLARLMFSKEEAGETDIQVQSTGDYQTIKTQVGRLMGTPQYMSPEQAQGLILDMDGRSDIYALGTILYELVYLERAIDGENLIEVVNRVVRGEIKDTPSQTPYEHLPEGLPAIIRKATASNKAERYASADELADALRVCIHSRTPPTAPPSSTHDTKSTRHRFLLGSGWILAFLVFAVMLGGTLYQREQWSQDQQASIQRIVLRENILRQRTTQTIQQAHRIERIALHAKWLTQRLAEHARHNASISSSKGRKRTSTASYPTQLSPQKGYAEKISLTQPTVQWSSQLKKRTVRKKLRFLNALSSAQRSIYGHNQDRASSPLQSFAFTSFIFAKRGFLSVYPGYSPTLSYTKVLQQTKYDRLSSVQHSVWLPPHFSPYTKKHIQVAYIKPFKSPSLQGAVGVSIQLSYLHRQLSHIVSKDNGLDEAWIVDQQGYIVTHALRSMQKKKKTYSSRISKHIYPNQELVQQFREKTKQGRMVVQNGKAGYTLTLYRKIAHTDWYYLTNSVWPQQAMLPKEDKK